LTGKRRGLFLLRRLGRDESEGERGRDAMGPRNLKTELRRRNGEVSGLSGVVGFEGGKKKFTGGETSPRKREKQGKKNHPRIPASANTGTWLKTDNNAT